MSVVLDDFVLQVPRKNQQVIRTRLPYVFWRVDGDPNAREKLPLFVGTAVDDVIHEVGSNAAVIQERVALGGGAVGGNFFSALLGVNEELQELALGLFDLLGKA